MKKLFTLIAILLFIIGELFSQSAGNYVFTYSTGTYTEITGTISTASGDDAYQSGIPIPFTFNYCGTGYTNGVVCTNGWFELGTTYQGTVYSNDLASTTYKPFIAAVWDDLSSPSGSIQYTTLGTAPNRIFVIQWKNVSWNYGGTASQNFQIRLYETTNVIDIVYGSMATPSSASASIGMNDQTGGSGHFLSVTPGTTPVVSNTVANNSINAVTYLTNGLTYTFTPPVAPILYIVPSSLAFGYVPYGNSAVLNYVLSGSYLTTGPIVVTAPTAYGVSLSSGGPYTPSINVNYTPPTLANTNIYVQFTPLAANTNYIGNITNVGGGASANVAVSGTSDLESAYCSSLAGYTADEEIYSVTVGGNTNAYDCFTVAPGTGSLLNRYSNFHPLGSFANLPLGTLVPYTVSENECDGATFYSFGCGIWIDFNQDGDYNDADEAVLVESATAQGPRDITGNITVPVGATLGQTGMRITVAENYSGATLTPCLAYGYGETEDYWVTITEPDYGSLNGFVYDSQGGCTSVLAGATVTNGIYTTTTNGSGFYEFASIPVGTYSFTASLANYVSQTINNIAITFGNNTSQDFCLEPYGALQGFVYDAQGGCVTPLVGATISDGTNTTTTDGTGFYQFPGIAPGTYSFTASLANFVNQTINNIIVSSGATTDQDFCLEPYLAPPVGLTATATGDDVHLAWSPPGSIPDQWIFWDNGVQYDAIGTGGAAVFDVASRWPVEDIALYDGMYLSKIEFYPYVASTNCTYTVKVWKGVNAGTLLYSYTIPAGDIIASAWNTITFPGVVIDGTDEFWFGYECNTTTGYPAGCDAGPAIVNKGDMMYYGGVWQSITTFGLNYNWCLHGWVSSVVAGPLAPMPITQMEKPVRYENSGTLTTANFLSEFSKTTANKFPGGQAAIHKVAPQHHGSTPKMLDATLTGYNVYRNTLQIASNIVETFYDDLNLAPGGYDYQVSAQYDYGESVLIGPAHVDIYSCGVPTNFLVPMATVTTTSATANWTPSIYTPATEWIVEYGLAGFAHGAGIAIQHVYTTPTYTMNSLAPGTAYDVYVRTFCAEGDSSLWAMRTFRTHYFECPVGATAEVEPCGEDLNGGCNMPVPTFEPLLCGETKCGTAWYSGGTRDTDWYEFTLTETTEVTWSGSAEFSLILGFIASPCPATDFIAYSTGAPGATVTVNYQLAAGTYYAFAASSMIETVLCDSLDLYFATLTCNTCAHPTAQITSNITGTGADFSWTDPDGLYWDLYIVPLGDPDPTSGSTPTVNDLTATSYTWAGGLPATSYKWFVRTDCGQNNSDVSTWTGPANFTTLICDPIDRCNYTFRMTDSYGDGWNGNTMSVIQEGVTVQTLSLLDGTGPVDVLVGLCGGYNFELFWNAGGSWSEEVGIEIIDPLGVSVYNKPPGTGSPNTSLYIGITNCTPPACPEPTNLAVSNITMNSAELSWNGPPDSFFDVFFGPGSDPFLGTLYTTVSSPLIVTDLETGNEYGFTVRTDCGFETPKVDYFWMAMDGPGILLPPHSGGTIDEPFEDGTWYLYDNAPGEMDWWNIWFYNDPVDNTRMKKIRMGFWVSTFDNINPGVINYVINWSDPAWPGPGFPTPIDEVFIHRSPVNGPMPVPPGAPIWIELYFIIPDYNPEWVSVDIWGENITIEQIPSEPPMSSPLRSWWDPLMPGGMIVHECLPKNSGPTSTWSDPVLFTTLCPPPYILPLCQSFDPPMSAIPNCWTEQLEGLITSPHWSVVPINAAGGAYNEAMAGWSPNQGATQADNDRMVSPALNTSGMTSINLSFKQYLDDYEADINDVWVKVQSSADGLTWTDEWVYPAGLGVDIPPENKNMVISNNVGSTTYLAWTLAGKTYDINSWHVDDICIYESCSVIAWTGAVSTAWNDPANWSCGILPNNQTTVQIPAGLINYPVVPAGITAYCYQVELSTGATLSVESNGVLKVTNP